MLYGKGAKIELLTIAYRYKSKVLPPKYAGDLPLSYTVFYSDILTFMFKHKRTVDGEIRWASTFAQSVAY